MQFHLVPPAPLDGRALAVVNRCAAVNLEKRGYLKIEKNLFGEHERYVLTAKGRQTFEEGERA